jgi:hypothetical protein
MDVDDGTSIALGTTDGLDRVGTSSSMSSFTIAIYQKSVILAVDWL